MCENRRYVNMDANIYCLVNLHTDSSSSTISTTSVSFLFHIKPIALAMVYKTARTVKIPIIGIGGISSTEDVLEFLFAGASAVQIGTANYIDPSITMKVIDGLLEYCKKNNLKSLVDLPSLNK